MLTGNTKPIYFTEWLDIQTLQSQHLKRAEATLKEGESPTPTPPTHIEIKMKSIEAKLYLRIGSDRDGKQKLLDNYIARLKSIAGVSSARSR